MRHGVERCVRMSYSEQSGFPVHRNCANFKSGICILIGAAVDPSEPACQNFTPKSLAETLQTVEASTGTGQPCRPRLPQSGYGFPVPYARPPWVRYEQGSTMQSVGFLFMSSGRRGRGGREGGRGRMGGLAAGLGGFGVCPRCGYSAPHVIGIPCSQETCPKCGSRMTRGS